MNGAKDADRPHGTTRRYRVGCRCPACRAANSARVRDQVRRRAADPATADRAGHGKPSTYTNYGCRCEECRDAKRAYAAARQGDPRVLAAAKHGTRSTYTALGCRCAPCSAANSTYARAWYRRRAASP